LIIAIVSSEGGSLSIYLIFLLGWFWLLVMVTGQLNDRSPPLLTATPLMRRIAAGLFVSAMLLAGPEGRRA
jgi:hypothetical protein